MTDTKVAVWILDTFTRAWCNEGDFECADCEFLREDGYCAVELFKSNKWPDRDDGSVKQ